MALPRWEERLWVGMLNDLATLETSLATARKSNQCNPTNLLKYLSKLEQALKLILRLVRIDNSIVHNLEPQTLMS